LQENDMTTTRASIVCTLLAATLGASLLAGCYTNRTTGRKQLSGGQDYNSEVALGAAASPQLVSEMGGESQNPALRGYIDEVGQRLKTFSDRDINGQTITQWDGAPPGPQRTWYFTLIDSDVINAFALPGERVFMSRGLADKMTSEAQLAGVLGHEIGHVMARHTAERIGQSQLGQGILSVGGLFAGGSQGGQLAMQGGQLLIGGQLLKYSRDQESEADKLGMRYMSEAGYNPRGQLEVMQILKAAAGGGKQPEWMSTHPLPETRINDIQNLLNSIYAHTQSGPQAGNYQTFEDRFRQRYLAVRAAEPTRPSNNAAPRTPTNDGTRRNLAPRRSELPTDPNGRTRMLAAFTLEDPTSWCLVCAENPELAAEAKAIGEHFALHMLKAETAR
jgi:beta-barrel assembly-enhancing protease